MKYKRADDEGSLRERLQKINIRSIRKKGDRFAGYLKILAGAESQVRAAFPLHSLTMLCKHGGFELKVNNGSGRMYMPCTGDCLREVCI